MGCVFLFLATQLAMSRRVHRYRLALHARREVSRWTPRADAEDLGGRSLPGAAGGVSALDRTLGIEVS